MSALTRKLLDAATKTGVAVLAKSAPMVVAALVRQWNQLALRGEVERARAQILQEYRQNRELARAIYAKYGAEMRPEVRVIFEEVVGKVHP